MVKGLSFTDQERNSIPAGEQRIDIKLELKNVRTFEAEFHFQVEDSKKKLEKNEILHLSPPPDGFGNYMEYLPYILLDQSSLLFDGPDSMDRIPCLALLLFKKDEGAICVGEEEKLLRISKGEFNKYFPDKEELKLLVHTRVDEEVKHTCLCANRFPVGTNGEETAYTAYVAGLWPLSGFLLRGGELPVREGAVELPVLFQWSFVQAGDIPLFRKSVEGLSVDVLRCPVKGDASEEVNRRFSQGYIPIRYEMRSGETAAAWYRSPLIPCPGGEEGSPDDCRPGPDSLTVLDEKNGMFDVTYGVAWQMGRIMALLNIPFCNALKDYQREHKRQRLRAENASVLSRFGMEDTENVQELAEQAIELILRK